MPSLSMMKKKYEITVDDLPSQVGPNVVVIEGFDAEEGVDQDGQPFTRHQVWFAGWSLPLRLNNTRIEMLEQILGKNTEDCIGRKIALVATSTSAYGKTKITIGIHPYAVSEAARPVGVPPHLFCTSAYRQKTAAQYGVTMAIVGQAAAAIPPAGAKLGTDSAAELMLLLQERNRTWGWLVDHLSKAPGAIPIAPDCLPPDVDQSIRAAAWAVLRGLPVVAGIQGDRQAAKAKIIAAWVPPEPPAAPAAQRGSSPPWTSRGAVDEHGSPEPDDHDIPF